MFCNKAFISTRLNKIYCSAVCSNNASKIRNGRIVTNDDIPSQKKGSMHEFIVAVDLARKGFDVYISPFPQQLYDFLVVDRKTEKKYVIDVKTGYRNKKTGNLVYPTSHRHPNWDFLAIYIDNEDVVIYLNKKKNICSI